MEDGLQGVERVAVFMIRLGPMAECCWRDTLEGEAVLMSMEMIV